MGKSKTRAWTAVGAARAGREARIATVGHMRDAPIAREMQLSKFLTAFDVVKAQLGDPATAVAVLLGGMGFEPPYPDQAWAMAQLILDAEVEHLAAAPLYVLSPAMCDVVLAAAQTLTGEDLELLDADDAPSPAGVVMLPHPVLVRAVNGQLGDDRAYTWQTPARIVFPSRLDSARGCRYAPAVRISTFHDAHGPVRPDSFEAMAADAARRGTPLPPWLLDAVKSERLRYTPTETQRRNHEVFSARALEHGQAYRDAHAAAGAQEGDRVVGEYRPGQEVVDADDRFTTRFLYAFWRLCAQEIAEASPAEVTHSARVLSERAGVDPQVRVVEVRRSDRAHGPAEPSGRDWRRRWVVRMHKVRQWYPSEQRHRVLYRGPYIKGPEDKPLLGGEVVRGVTR